jgi:hypothetical protein
MGTRWKFNRGANWRIGKGERRAEAGDIVDMLPESTAKAFSEINVITPILEAAPRPSIKAEAGDVHIDLEKGEE